MADTNIDNKPAAQEPVADTKTDDKSATQEAPKPAPVPLEVRVGVAAIIRRKRDGRVLFGKRLGSHGAGSWALPGGHLDFGEEPLDCAERETREETGLKIHAKGIVHVTNDMFPDAVPRPRHYITIYTKCELEDEKAEPVIMEKDKCEEWRWMTWDEIKALPNEGEKLFLPVEHIIDQLGTEKLETLTLLPGTCRR